MWAKSPFKWPEWNYDSNPESKEINNIVDLKNNINKLLEKKLDFYKKQGNYTKYVKELKKIQKQYKKIWKKDKALNQKIQKLESKAILYIIYESKDLLIHQIPNQNKRRPHIEKNAKIKMNYIFQEIPELYRKWFFKEFKKALDSVMTEIHNNTLYIWK